ncbi:MAG TPA: DUF2783 domain-containing protein [Allosphingosinicella sp.]
MAKLVTTPNIARPDDLYQALIDLHQGRSDEESERVNARLILLLANHIGDEEAIGEAIRIAGARHARDGGEA